MSRFKIWSLVIAAALFSSIPGNRFTLTAPAKVGAQSVCTPPLYQGYPSTCATITVNWLSRDPIAQIDHFDIFRVGVKMGEAPAGASFFSDHVGCSFGAGYTIRQVMKSGATCSTETTGNLPHTRPCQMCIGSRTVLNVTSAATFNYPIMPNSIATLFPDPGQNLTSATAAATGELPLPTTLGGTQVLLEGTPTGLFYVSPNQINFLMSPHRSGVVNMVITGPNGERTEGVTLTGPNPGIFTANGSGKGVAAGLITADGASFQRIFDAGGNAIPVSVGSAGRPHYLILFGTSLRNAGEVSVKIGRQACTVVWAGAHSSMPGLDQINVLLPESIRGLGLAPITVSVGGFPGNYPMINIGN